MTCYLQKGGHSSDEISKKSDLNGSECAGSASTGQQHWPHWIPAAPLAPICSGRAEVVSALNTSAQIRPGCSFPK